MKIKHILILGLIFLPFLSFANPFSKVVQVITEIQNEITIDAVFDGHEDYGYNFLKKHENGDEHTITFQKLKEGLLSEFDLNAQAFVGARFKITYTSKIVVTKDADGYDDEQEINTIVKLVKL